MRTQDADSKAQKNARDMNRQISALVKFSIPFAVQSSIRHRVPVRIVQQARERRSSLVLSWSQI
jgi:hypothetical protein